MLPASRRPQRLLVRWRSGFTGLRRSRTDFDSGVVSGFSRTSRGPPEGGHYIQSETALVSCEALQLFGGLTFIQVVVGLDERRRCNPRVKFSRSFRVASIRIDPRQVEPMDNPARIVLHRCLQQTLCFFPARETEDVC